MSTTKYIVNNASGQTITGDITINGNLNVTGVTNTRPYKVYTALLTQSGGNDPYVINSGPVTEGVTYIFSNSKPSQPWDFSNVGGPVFPDTNDFVATSSGVPNEYGTANLTYNTGAPVVTVLENTIGNIWFSYEGTGYYKVSSEPESLFTVGKTVSFIGSVGEDIAGEAYGFLRPIGDANFYILTKNTSEDANGMLVNTPIEIRVYN